VNKDGFWVESEERIPVDIEGDPLELIESSFAAPILLNEVVDETALLDHPIRLAYSLATSEVPETLMQELTEGKIYNFGFSYRGGPVADPALRGGSDG